MQDKTWYSILGLDAEPLFLQDHMLNGWSLRRTINHFGCTNAFIAASSFIGSISEFLVLEVWIGGIIWLRSSSINEFITYFSQILNLQFYDFFHELLCFIFWGDCKVSFAVMINSYIGIFDLNRKHLPCGKNKTKKIP